MQTGASTSNEAATTGNDQLPQPDSNSIITTTAPVTTSSTSASSPNAATNQSSTTGVSSTSSSAINNQAQSRRQQSKSPSDSAVTSNQQSSSTNPMAANSTSSDTVTATSTNHVDSSTGSVGHHNTATIPSPHASGVGHGGGYHQQHHHQHSRHGGPYHGGGGGHHHGLGGGGGGGNYHQHQQHHHHHHNSHHHHHHNNNIGSNNSKYNPRGDSESNLNHVLLITVINPHYNINCDLIHQICSSYGKVNRIVIFRKNGVQAMVEFDNVESAKRARSMLNGCDIYSGCCTLRIEYAKPTRLNVHKNDGDSFDYTNPNLAPTIVANNNGQDGHPNNLNDQPPPQHQLQTGGTDGSGQIQTIHPNHQGIYNHMHGGPPHSHQHRGPGSNRRGGLGGGSNGSGHHQNMNPTHHHQVHHQQQHSQQHGKQGGVQQQHEVSGGPYAIGHGPIDQSTGQPGDPGAFHQEAGFNVPRAGPPSNYVAMDSYMPPHGAPTHAPPVHGSHYTRHGGGGHDVSHHQQHHSHSRSGMTGGPGSGDSRPANHNHNSSFGSGNAAMSGSNSGPPLGNVMMVYGLLPERINCDRLFNLLCLYGNVVRIKFLRTKEGCAMVQMSDLLAVDRCFSSLNKISLFSNEVQISYSKQPFIHEVIQPFILPDGSPSFKDFLSNKNNRFKNPEVASKNRILPPSHVLHFFNAPFGITEGELLHVFKQNSGHEPVSLKIFTPKAENTKSYSGLVTFRDSAEASEALVLCNHLEMPKTGAPHPYILRLCFSPPTYTRSPYAASQQTTPAQ